MTRGVAEQAAQVEREDTRRRQLQLEAELAAQKAQYEQHQRALAAARRTSKIWRDSLACLNERLFIILRHRLHRLPFHR